MLNLLKKLFGGSDAVVETAKVQEKPAQAEVQPPVVKKAPAKKTAPKKPTSKKSK